MLASARETYSTDSLAIALQRICGEYIGGGAGAGELSVFSWDEALDIAFEDLGISFLEDSSP